MISTERTIKVGDRIEIIKGDYPGPHPGLRGTVIALVPAYPVLRQVRVMLDRHITREWCLYECDLRRLDAVEALADIARTAEQ